MEELIGNIMNALDTQLNYPVNMEGSRIVMLGLMW
jgi:hypothetical protein